MKKLLSFFLYGLCLSLPPVNAQSTNATLSGGVTDPAGTFIVSAEIDIANDTTGVVYSTKTNTSGIYYVSVLPPGNYHVQVSKIGFKTLVKPDVVLNVQSALSLNFSLPVGATSESITVDAASTVINTTDASVSTVVDRKFVENMPLNGRSFQDLISMTPGVVTQNPQSSLQVVGTGGDFSVNGQRSQSNYYTVDGVTGNIGAGNGGGVGEAATGGVLGGSTTVGTTQALLSVDALQEFRVQSSTYSAEFGRSPGGQFSLLTRSGTDIFHGSAFDYLRNDFFDANDWFNDYYGKPTPALRQNDFGGTFGGPIWIPKLYDGKGRSFFFASYEGLRLTQPTPALIQYVPDTYMRRQAVSAMQGILNAFPVPNGTDYGTEANPSLAEFIAPFSLPSSIDSTSVRIDHIHSQKLSVFFRFGDTPSSTSSRPYFARSKTSSNAQTYTLGVTSQLSGHVTDEFRLGYARSDSSQIGTLDSFGGATPLDLTAAIGGNSNVNTQPVFVLYIPGIGESLLTPYFGRNLSRQWNLIDTFALSAGRHSLKLGVDYRHIKAPIMPPDVLPYAEFMSAATMLAGAPEITEFSNYKPATPLINETALFIQDEWRLHQRLNLSLGLRWEVNPPPTAQHGNNAYTLLGSISDPSTLRLAPQGTPLWKTAWYNFAPRFGMAWIVRDRASTETVLRGGAGVFFDTANEISTLGYNGVGFSAYQIAAGATIPYTSSELNVPITATAPYTGATVYAFPVHLQLPYTLEWNVSLQQALGKEQTLTASYIGSSGRRLLNFQEYYLAGLNSDFGVVEYPASGVTSNYEALQLQFQRSITHGFQALASYTLSHAIDFGSNSASLPLQRGNSDFDVRNNFQGGVSWDLPGSHLSNRSAKSLLRNWGIDTRVTARSSFPVTLGGSLTLDSATGTEYAGTLNRISDQPTYLRGSQYPGGRRINPAAFCLPSQCTGTIASRNFVRGFSATQVNLSMRREFHIYDPVSLQFRAETFNLLNHPNFGYIDATYTDATFGQATKMLSSSLGTVASQYQQGGPRSMQFALRITF